MHSLTFFRETVHNVLETFFMKKIFMLALKALNYTHFD